MAFNFGFFGSQDHKVFNYKPRYYDPKKEELKKKFGHVDGTDAKKDENYVPGSYLRGSMTGNDGRKTVGKAQSFIGIFSLILFFVVLIYAVKIFSTLWN